MNLFKTALGLTVALASYQPAALAHHTHASRTVTATVYDGWYHGRTTACGQTYSDYKVSAAHPWLPCGTRVRVSHQGRSLVVPITDRCACESIDLSYSAARRLGVPVDGTARVQLQEL